VRTARTTAQWTFHFSPHGLFALAKLLFQVRWTDCYIIWQTSTLSKKTLVSQIWALLVNGKIVILFWVREYHVTSYHLHRPFRPQTYETQSWYQKCSTVKARKQVLDAGQWLTAFYFAVVTSFSFSPITLRSSSPNGAQLNFATRWEVN